MHAKHLLPLLFWTFVLTLTGLLFWNSRGYLSDPRTVVFYRERIQDAPPGWRQVLIAHVLAGMLCLFTGPFLFIPLLKKRITHAVMGSIYAFSTLGVMLPTGLWLSLHAHGGFIGRLGFFLTGCWMTSVTLLGLYELCRCHIRSHTRWMVRSYAVALSALTFRLLYLSGYYAGFSYTLNYSLSTWASTLLNLLIAEGIIHFYFNPKTNPQGKFPHEKVLPPPLTMPASTLHSRR